MGANLLTSSEWFLAGGPETFLDRDIRTEPLSFGAVATISGGTPTGRLWTQCDGSFIDGLNLFWNQGGTRWTLQKRDSLGSTTDTYSPNGTASVGVRHVLGFRIDGIGSVQWFIDGEPVVSQNNLIAGNDPTNGGAFRVGRIDPSANLQGVFADFWFLDDACDNDTFKSIANSEGLYFPDGAHVYRCDGREGDACGSIVELSGSGNDLVPQGGPVYADAGTRFG